MAVRNSSASARPTSRKAQAEVTSPRPASGPEIRELIDDEELYDADIEIVEPDAYEDADSDDEFDTSGKSSDSGVDTNDWQREILPQLKSLDCDSEDTSPSTPTSSNKKRKRDDDLTFIRMKSLKDRSPTPQVEIEEVVSDEPVQHARQRSKPLRKIQSQKSRLGQKQQDVDEVSSSDSPRISSGEGMDMD